jgi:hypothetical protein
MSMTDTRRKYSGLHSGLPPRTRGCRPRGSYARRNQSGLNSSSLMPACFSFRSTSSDLYGIGYLDLREKDDRLLGHLFAVCPFLSEPDLEQLSDGFPRSLQTFPMRGQVQRWSYRVIPSGRKSRLANFLE